ncbi:MAG: hypothetical protein II719_04925, partial [Clostridia bacterium]|nr:hypothetical protein [Clostridia bacterium]
EDIVSRYSDLDSGDYWAKKSSTIVCSGPFTLKNMDPDQAGLQLTLQRNYYYRDLSGGKDVAIDKYVKPYRLNMIFKLDSKGRQTAYDYDFNTGELTVEGTKVVLNERADKIQYLADVDMNTSGAVVQDIPNTYSMLLNCRNEVLSDPAVRQALSVSLDRNHIASLLKNAKPATGLVPYGVYYTDLGGKAYRDVAPDVYNTSADTALAKSLLSGKSKGEIKLTYYRAKEGAADVANYIKETWEALGFKVTLDPKGINLFARTILRNNVTLEYDYDIVLLDYQTLATNAFSLLAPYAVPFSGAGKDTKNNNFEDVPGITGYSNSAYDALIEEVYAADSRQAAAEKLTEAEALLAKDSPMITLAFNVDTYIYNKSLLSNIGTTIFGVRDFTNTRMKDYESYKPIETEEEEMSTDEAPQVQE